MQQTFILMQFTLLCRQTGTVKETSVCSMALSAVLPVALPAEHPPMACQDPPSPQVCGRTPAAQLPWRRLWKLPVWEERRAHDSVHLLPERQSAPAAGGCLGLLWLSGCTWTPAGLRACCTPDLHPGQWVHNKKINKKRCIDAENCH